jgi:hypothetical protein
MLALIQQNSANAASAFFFNPAGYLEYFPLIPGPQGDVSGSKSITGSSPHI